MKPPFEIPNPRSTILANILAVDDDPAVLGFLTDLLLADGHHVVAVESGEAALEQIEAGRFHLALIDLKMGGIGGIEVLAELRRRAPDTAAIILTAHGSLNTAIEALRQGAHDYLLKPCKPDEIRAKVRSALDVQQRDLRQHDLITELHRLSGSFLQADPAPVPRLDIPLPPAAPEPGPTQSGIVEWRTLIVDYARRRIALAGRPLELSPTEFDLLAYLARAAPRVVSAQELVHEVHGYTSKPQDASQAIRSHVHHIRQKIASTTGQRDVIQTVRGVGYALSDLDPGKD